MDRLVENIPTSVILKAIEGDAEALATVLNYHKGFIRYLSSKKVWDEYGNEHFYVDSDIESRLEAKLIASIVTGFKVLEK